MGTFIHPDPSVSSREQDAWNDRVIDALNREGTAFFSGSNWGGMRVMRISVVNWQTTGNDVAKTLEAARRVVEIERRNAILPRPA